MNIFERIDKYKAELELLELESVKTDETLVKINDYKHTIMMLENLKNYERG